MQNILKITQQTFWQIIGKFITSAASFVILGIIARNYGEASTGIYTLTITYLAIFFILADFGFNAHVLKTFQDAKIEVQNIEWRKLLGLRIVWASGLAFLAVALLPILPFATTEFTRAVIFGSLSVIAYSIFVSCNLIFQSRLKYELSLIASSVGTIVWFLVVYWFVSLGLGVPYLVLSHFLGWVIISFLAILLTLGLTKVWIPLFDFGYIKKLFKTSWPIAATLSLNVIYFRADAFLVSYFKGSVDVGIYNVAYQVFQSILVLPTYIMNSFYPMMLNTFKYQISNYKLQIRNATMLLGLISIFLSLITYFFSPYAIQLITGTGFSGSVISLQILSLGFPAYFLSALFMWVMVTKKMYKNMLVIYSLGLIVNIVSNLIFIPQYSYIAASWITGISEYLILMLQIVIIYRLSRA